VGDRFRTVAADKRLKLTSNATNPAQKSGLEAQSADKISLVRSW
jgi:hypothetical protein